jgi:hypothetical protein
MLASDTAGRLLTGYLPDVPHAKPLPNGVVTRAEAAEILGVSTKRVTKLRSAGRLGPATPPNRRSGLYWREQVEALAASRAEREASRQRPK